MLEDTLARTGLTQVLHGFRSGRQSGVLHLDPDGATRRIYFKDGAVVFASSDVGSDRLGEILVRSGKLKRSELELACKVRETSQLRLGKTLVDMGYVSDAELDSLLKEQVEWILQSLLPWHSGSYRAELRDAPVDENDADLLRADISLENVILGAYRRITDSETIRRGIGDLAGTLRFATDAAWIGKTLRLTPAEGFVLSRVDGEASAADIAMVSPLGEDETLRCICALVAAGALEVEPSPGYRPPPPPSPPKAASPVRPARTPPKNLYYEPPPKPAVTAAARTMAAPPPAAHAELSTEAQCFQEEMLEKHRTAHQVTYYELLDVEATASPDAIKQGYFRLAKRLHPDHRSGLRIVDPERKLDDLYLAIKAAYEVLSSPAERRRYDFSLEKTAPKPAAAASLAPAPKPSGSRKPAPKVPQRTFDAQQMARLHYTNGQRFFNEARYHEAIEELQDAVRLDGGRPEYHRLLGFALAKNPKWRRRAEEHFRKVLEVDRFDIETMLALGDIFEAGGMETRAHKMYEEALGMDPGNARALEKLHGAEPTSTMDKLKGILNRGKGH